MIVHQFWPISPLAGQIVAQKLIVATNKDLVAEAAKAESSM